MNYPQTRPMGLAYADQLTPLAPPQLIGIYGSAMGRVWDLL